MRWFVFFLKLLVLVVLAAWLVSSPGTANFTWHGYVVQTSAAFIVAVIALAVIVLLQLARIWRWIVDGPRFWRLRQKIQRMQLGQEQITKGLVAIAAGNVVEAGRLAVSARKLLGPTTATRLLQAQAAQLAGDHQVAKEIYRSLANNPESAVLGYRGLIMASLREGKWEEAEAQVQKLSKEKPNTPWVNLIKFELAAKGKRWSEASQALSKASYARLLDPSRAKRHQAALLLAESENATEQGKEQEALELAEKALRQAPDWQPAMITLARKQLVTNHVRAALRTIEKSWTRAPHPQLAELYQLASKASNPIDVHKQMERLTRTNAEHPVSQRALAQTALDADLWGEARRYLMSLVSVSKATQGVYRLLSRLERRETGNEQTASQWLMKAAEALPDPRWMCSSCGGSQSEWQVTCSHCKSFNKLDWQTPGTAREENTGLLIGNIGNGV